MYLDYNPKWMWAKLYRINVTKYKSYHLRNLENNSEVEMLALSLCYVNTSTSVASLLLTFYFYFSSFYFPKLA